MEGTVPPSKIRDVCWKGMKDKIFQLHWRNSNTNSVLARLIVGFMAVDIRFRIHNDLLPWQNSGLRVAQSVISITPPTLSQIPFAKLMTNMPFPFESAVERFNTCHLEMMASKEFLEAGEWVGYRCSSMEGAWWYCAPPIQGIFFRVQDESAGNVIRLRARGFDAVGRFRLAATLHSDTGGIRVIQKHHGVADKSVWLGTLTPFGIAGSFGSNNAWFWLWKADWSR